MKWLFLLACTSIAIGSYAQPIVYRSKAYSAEQYTRDDSGKIINKQFLGFINDEKNVFTFRKTTIQWLRTAVDKTITETDYDIEKTDVNYEPNRTYYVAHDGSGKRVIFNVPTGGDKRLLVSTWDATLTFYLVPEFTDK